MIPVQPCARPENDPQDWFIEADGKQYRWESFEVTPQQETLIRATMADEDPEVVDKVIKRQPAEAKKRALARRRQAKQACMEDCHMRLLCLDMGLEEQNIPFGTWGGYYSEERAEIHAVRSARRPRRE